MIVHERIWFDNLTKRDARLLASWWNAHTPWLYFVRRIAYPSCKRAKYRLVRQ